MGIAIILIILSHLLSACKEIRPLWIFYPGFAGVDIFLFLSGYGLCNSWEKNTTGEFYARRLRRILPMFLLLQVYVCMNQFLTDKDATWLDVLCNFTTLSFWGVGGLRIEWYLSFLVYLYLLFPILYKATHLGGLLLPASLLGCVLAMQYLTDWPWNMDAAFPRIPVFALGILCYQARNPRRAYCVMSLLYGIAAILVAYMVVTHRAEKYQIVYMCAPLLMMALSAISAKITEKGNAIYRLFGFCGKYSLEMYVANMMTLSLVPTFALPPYTRLLTYIALQALLTFIIVHINIFIQKKHAV